MDTTEPGGEPRGPAPLVSIVVPTCGRPALLAEAIASALGQRGFNDFEVLVLDNDDAPADPAATMAVIETFPDPRLRYHRNAKNLGMTGNWNRGLELARGTWMTLLHDDDLLYPAFLARVVPLFTRADLIVCKVAVGSVPPSQKQTDSNPRPPRARTLDRVDLAFSNPSPAPGVIFRREPALRLGGFDAAWYPCADYDFWIRYVTACRALLLPERLAFYRILNNESLRIATRIQIAEMAGRLQQALVGQLIPGSRFSSFIAESGVLGLLHAYCRDPWFRGSPELADFARRHGYRIDTPGWRLKARTSLAKRLLRWRAKESRP